MFLESSFSWIGIRQYKGQISFCRNRAARSFCFGSFLVRLSQRNEIVACTVRQVPYSVFYTVTRKTVVVVMVRNPRLGTPRPRGVLCGRGLSYGFSDIVLLFFMNLRACAATNPSLSAVKRSSEPSLR